MTRIVSPRASTTRRTMVALAMTLTLFACTDDSESDASDAAGNSASTTTSTEAASETNAGDESNVPSPGTTIAELTDLLPAETAGAFAIDFDALLLGNGTTDFAWLVGSGADPAFSEMFAAMGSLTAGVDVPRGVSSALVAQPRERTHGPFVLAALRSVNIDATVAELGSSLDETYGQESLALYMDGNGNHVAVLPNGVFVAGELDAVKSVIDAADGATGGEPVVPFRDLLTGGTTISFAYGLPALLNDVPFDGTLQTASMITGALDVVEGELAGDIAFHMPDAGDFVASYNTLNRHATQHADAVEQPLTANESAMAGLEQVSIPLPRLSVDASAEDVMASRSVFKKLFVGMEASQYAESVADRTNGAWLDFLVKSEQDEQTPRSPGSVYIRWEFRDEAAIDAFEANELPAGFRLAPTRFLESDDPNGEYFLALNLYNAGSALVNGARAEWDVFVHGPDGADPNAGERPRFMVVEALAEEVSADSGNLLTPAEPLSHVLEGDLVVSSVKRFDGENQIAVFESTFPKPDPALAEVARFTREMAIGNDYIYWAHGVSDRVLYNATTFNHDAYFVDTTQLTYTDDSPWAQYLKPVVKDAVYYDNTLEYVASPMANLDSEHLDITPEWLDKLVGFTTNGHQEGLMRKAVEQMFRGEEDALVGLTIGNETPSTYVNFEITDPDALAAALDLPVGTSLAALSLFEGGTEAHYLTLSVYEVDEAVGGPRAEWTVYVDDGSGRPHMMVVDAMTAEVGIDSANLLNLPDVVQHDLTDGRISINLSSTALEFEAAFDTSGGVDEELSLDWIEAGDNVCSSIGVCDKFFYDAETLDVPVSRADGITITAFDTPWNEFLAETPSAVFTRDNAQEYVAARWHNLEVPVDALPFSGLENATHTIAGDGTLMGRTSDVANSDYTYTGDAILDGEQLDFAIDQEINNALGIGNIFTTGSFDLETGTGTVTVVDCQGSALLCSDIEPGSSTFYTTEGLDASDPDAISWQVNVVVDLGGFGIADSASSFEATHAR